MKKVLYNILSKLPLSNKDIADLCDIIITDGQTDIENRVSELERKVAEIETNNINTVDDE